MIVYLGGPINGCTDEEANGWRQGVIAVLAQAGQVWLDPMRNDYRGKELDPGITELIVEDDKADIDRSDALLMNCPKPSYGTAMEIFYGWLGCKRVLVVLPDGATPSPWVLYHATEVHYGSVVAVARDLCASRS